MPEDLRTAIVGVGAWGRNVARELSRTSSLAAFVSSKTSEEELQAVDTRLDVPRRTMEQVLRDPGIAALAIATPIPLLSRLARAALESGKHVLVEKPLSKSAADARAVADMASSRGLVLTTGYIFIYHPVCTELERRLDMLRVRGVTLRWSKYGTFAEPIEQALLTHHLAVAMHLFGSPLAGTIRKGPAVKTACDSIEVRLSYGNFDVVSLIDRTSPQRSHTMEFEMTDGSRLIWEDACLYLMQGDGAAPEIVYRSDQSALGVEVSNFVAAASGKRSTLPTSGEFAAKVLAIAEMLRLVR
jgi:predicted dehydrogenase